MAALATPLLADTTNMPPAAVAPMTMPPMAMPMAPSPSVSALGDEAARVSYAIGLSEGTGLKSVDFVVNTDLFLRGLKDGQAGISNVMTQAELTDTLGQFRKKIQAAQAAKHAELAAKTKAEGEAFLATNKDNPGVISLPSGLQYKVLTAGDGPIPTAASSVTVNYRGTFINGTEFDNSAKSGHPFTANVTGGIIKGWTEALQLMKVGSKWQLYIPSSLAYGERGNRGIPPNSVLIFDIELLAINPPKAAPVTPTPVAPPPTSLTSDIIKVPSADEMKKGAQIERIKAEDLPKIQAQAQSQTNTVTH